MERPDPTGFYVVDALGLHQTSKRPHHLERRMRQRHRESSPGEPQTGQHPQSDPAVTTTTSPIANREALIEARRQRLSSKFTHMKEAVSRTEQKQSKDLTRKRSLLNRSLKLAETNRNRILRNQVRQCALNNEKAREVADRQRKLSLERSRIKKAALEERMRATTARRERFLVMSKKGFLEDVGKQQEAAKIIQKWWRSCRLVSLLTPLTQEFGLVASRIREMPFQKTMLMLQDKRLIKATARLISFLNRCAKKRRIRANSGNIARIFLSSFFMIYHTDEIFPHINPQESALLDTAKAMADLFVKLQERFVSARACNQVCEDDVHSAIKGFWSAFKYYHTSFEAWKSQDMDKMLHGMIEHYVQLEKMITLVKTQEPAREEFEPQIRAQQEDVKGKLARMGGPNVLRKLEEALEEYRHRETATSDDEGAMSLDEQMEPATPSAASQRTTSRKPSTQSVQSAHSTAPRDPDATSQLSDESMARESHELQRVLNSLGSSVSNIELAHEILMDPDFTLSPERLLGKDYVKVQTIMRKAFFDSIRERIAVSDYEGGWLQNLLEEIRQGLHALIPHPETSKLAYLVNETLDSGLIMQQATRGVLNPSTHLEFILDVMSKICAPARDADVRAIRAHTTDVAARLGGIMDLLEQMKIDLANYHLSLLRPFLKVHATEYERKKFDEAEASGALKLDLTRAWLRDGFERLKAVEGQGEIRGVTVKPDHVLIEAFLDILFATTSEPLNPGRCPETLNMDAKRLFEYQNDLQALTIVSALLILTRNFASLSTSKTEKLKQDLVILLHDTNDLGLDNLVAQVTSVLNESSSSSASSTSSARSSDMLASMVRKTLQYDDAVYKAVADRTRGAMRKGLRQEGYEMEWVGEDLERVGAKVGMLVRFNGSVHRRRYEGIIRGL